MVIQAATKADAEDLAYLINIAGEGIPAYFWSDLVEGDETPFAVGIRRAQREDGGFSYTKARVIKEDNAVAGMIVSYPLDDPYNLGDLNDYPEIVRPMVMLESKAPGSWYINALATKEQYRGRGIATRLLKEAEAKARAFGAKSMSIIVSNKNAVAKALYLNLGYQITASLPVVRVPALAIDGIWELLVKPI